MRIMILNIPKRHNMYNNINHMPFLGYFIYIYTKMCTNATDAQKLKIVVEIMVLNRENDK